MTDIYRGMWLKSTNQHQECVPNRKCFFCVLTMFPLEPCGPSTPATPYRQTKCIVKAQATVMWTNVYSMYYSWNRSKKYLQVVQVVLVGLLVREDLVGPK